MQVSTSSVPGDSGRDYQQFEQLIANRIASAQSPLFTTDATGLFDAYLDAMPEESRQHYRCHCCRRFIENYGGLVAIGGDGSTIPLLWTPGAIAVPDFFVPSVGGMLKLVRKSKVTGTFLYSLNIWGTPKTGEWTHLHGIAPDPFCVTLKNAEQVMADKRQDYITLHRGLAEIPLEAVVQAVRVLEADAVDRSEKTLGIARWLLALHRDIANLRGPARDNLIWLAIAKAPPGWCNIRSTMIATLLDDVMNGMPFDSIKRRWNEKMHPLQYQRPTTVKEGSIIQANKIIAKLQSEGSLQRRFARLEEVTALWTPRADEPSQERRKGGAFDHLRTTKRAAIKEVELPTKAMTWEKFRETVMSDAISIEASLPQHGAFFGMVTAVNADAPPLLQWDGLEGLPRNPVSWYFYNGGSLVSQWNLRPGWCKVNAMCLKPCHWQSGNFAHQEPGVFFVLDGAKDTRHMQGGSFFPENLRAEYHEIRSAMEAYAQSAKIAGRDEGTANGIALSGKRALMVRVKSNTGTASYTLSP